jgi:hypothetical protein
MVGRNALPSSFGGLLMLPHSLIRLCDSILSSFPMVAGIWGAGLLAAGCCCLVVLPRRPQLWKELPRERYVGCFIGWICLVWSASLAMPLLEGGLAGLRRLLPFLVFAVAVGSLLLDYLFTRALAGLMLLIVNQLLHLAFVAHVPARWLLSLVCYAFGVAALMMIAYPFRFRDLLEKATLHRRWRAPAGAFLLLAGMQSVVLAVFCHVR